MEWGAAQRDSERAKEPTEKGVAFLLFVRFTSVLVGMITWGRVGRAGEWVAEGEEKK